MRYDFDPNKLTEEKSLWDIYKKSTKIRSSKTQKTLMLITSILLLTNAFFLEKNYAIILNDLRNWAATGLEFAITTLGFLIAGFTIFSTLTKPSMMLAMMDHFNHKVQLPTLKYNFFVFIKVFIAYLFFSVVYAFVTILGQTGGFFSNVIHIIPSAYEIKTFLIKSGYVIVGSSFIYLLLQLNSFIFNIYTIVMNMLRWEYHTNVDNDSRKP